MSVRREAANVLPISWPISSRVGHQRQCGAAGVHLGQCRHISGGGGRRGHALRASSRRLSDISNSLSKPAHPSGTCSACSTHVRFLPRSVFNSKELGLELFNKKTVTATRKEYTGALAKAAFTYSDDNNLHRDIQLAYVPGYDAIRIFHLLLDMVYSTVLHISCT